MRRNISIRYYGDNRSVVELGVVNATVYGQWGVTRYIRPGRAKSNRYSVTHIPSGFAAMQYMSNAAAHALARELALHPILSRTDLHDAVQKNLTTKTDKAIILRAWRKVRDKYLLGGQWA